MLKRVICLLMSLVLLLGVLPAGVLQAKAETEPARYFLVYWNEDGTEKCWNYGDDPANLPSGVSCSLDAQTLNITLNNANLTKMFIMDWGEIAIHLVVEGTNTIHYANTDHNSEVPSALAINCCPNVTISGSGTLNLLSERATFSWHDFINEPYEDGHFPENPGGTLTISGVTINATSDHLHWSEDRERNENDYNPMVLLGGHVLITDGATVHAEGAGGIGVETKLTIDGASLTAPGLGLNPRGEIVSENPEDFFSSLTLSSGSISLRYPDYSNFNSELLNIGPNCRLDVNGGTLTLDDSGHDQCRNGVLHMWYSPDGPWEHPEISITGGKVDIKVGNLGRSGIEMGYARYVQSGGDVTVSVPYGNGVNIWDNGEFHLSGGTMRITGTENDPADGTEKLGMYIGRTSRATVSSEAELSISGNLDAGIGNDGSMLISGGTVDVDGRFGLNMSASLRILGGTVTAREFHPGLSTIHMLGGSLTAEDVSIYESNIRFAGGETKITDSFMLFGDPKTDLAYAEGIRPVDASGVEMKLASDNDYGWWLDGSFPITIKHQNAAAASGSVLLELMNAASLTAGTIEHICMAVSLPSTEAADAKVVLPQGMTLVENSVSVNGRAEAGYAYAGNVLTLPVRNGDLVTFAVSATSAGEKTVEATVDGVSGSLMVPVKDYTLSMANVVNTNSVPVSGTAAPGAVLKLFVDNQPVTSVTANAMGMWSAELPLDQGAKTYQIHAVMTVGADSFTTPAQSVACSASLPVVESLTFTNTIHGATDSDPNRDVSVTINYKERTRSQNYYTYWPELPDFTFRVKFENNSGTPETVRDVNVVATDYFGTEQSVPTAYDPGTGLWVGAAQFCGHNQIVPESFRVEWHGVRAGDSGSVDITPSPDTQEPYIPEPVEENHSTIAYVTAEDTTYTFDLSEDASGLRVTDSAGNEVALTGNSFTGVSGEIYYAALSSGTFRESGLAKLCVLMPSTGESSYQYAPNVHETKQDGLAVGDIYIDGDAAYKITAVRSDGSYETTTPNLGEVFESLSLDGLRIPQDGENLIVEEDLTAELEAAFLDSEVYAAYLMALEAYAEEEGVTPEAKPELSFGVTLGEYQEYQGKLLLPISINYDLTSHMSAELPVVGEVTTDVYSEFEYRYDFVVDTRVKMDRFAFQNLVFTVEETHTLRAEFGVKINDEGDDEQTASLEQFFNDAMEDVNKEQYLEGFEKEPEDDEKTIPLKHLKIRTNIPVLWIALNLDLEFVHSFSGDMTLNAVTTFGQKYGFSVDKDGQFDVFYTPKPLTVTVTDQFHMDAAMSLYLKASCGPELLNLIKVHLEGRAGPTLKIGGHGKVVLSNDPAQNQEDGNIWAGITMDLKIDLAGEIWLGDYHKKSLPLFAQSTPMGFIGTDFMPTRFTVREEEPVQVYDECDLQELIDLSMNYNRFSNGLVKGSKVMEQKDYSFEADFSGLFTVEDSTLKIKDPTKEIKGNYWVMVTYTSKDGGYEIKKQVPIEYHPAHIRIIKTTEDNGPRTAGFEITNRDGFHKNVSTPASGVVVVPVEPNKDYTVAEVLPPPGYHCTAPVQKVSVKQSEATVGFNNIKMDEPEDYVTPDVPIPGNGDPSGYIYEGIESNRLSGVTATVYRSDDPSGAGAVQWDALPFDQINPQTTDVLGQYLWMVPSGYYQVRWSKEGYTSIESEWMSVPPIRTNVNRNLVSTAPAEMQASFSEDMKCVILRFSRPVQVEPLNSRIQVTVGEENIGASVFPIDGGWTKTENPEDSLLCATTFQLDLYKQGVYKQNATIRVSSITYAGTEATHEAQVEVTTFPGESAHYVEVTDGSGTGVYETGSTVQASAQIPEGYLFDKWIAEGVTLADDTASGISFVMPDQDVRLTATFRQKPVTYPLAVVGGSGSGSFEEGQLVRVKAAVQEQKTFEQWEATGIALSEEQLTAPSLAFEMPAAPVTLKAVYRDKPETFQLEVTNGYGFGKYEAGSSVTVTAYPAEKDMYFHHWNAEGITLSAEETSAPIITVTMPANAVRLEAVYQKIPMLTVTGGSGSGSYPVGSTVSVTAQVPEGKEFDHWEASGITLTEEQRTNPAITVTMPDVDVSLTVVLKGIPVLYKLTVTGGSVTAPNASGSYETGTQVTVTADVPEGMRFDHWNAQGATLTDEQKTAQELTIAMPENDVTLEAFCEKNPEPDKPTEPTEPDKPTEPTKPEEPTEHVHTEEAIPGKNPTCTEEGLTEGKRCSVCGEILTAQKKIAAKGHTVVIDKGKEPTATEDGLTEGKHCSVCNTVLVKQEVIPAKGAEPEEPTVSTVPMYRLYNPYTQEHLLSGDAQEKDNLVSIGWLLDGVAWNAPTEGEPVYRLYNPFDDWHTYSRSQEEIDSLTALGWTVDGAVTFSAPAEDGMIIYRLFNPYVQTNYHLLTASDAEKDLLLGAGWKMDGGAWYAAKP